MKNFFLTLAFLIAICASAFISSNFFHGKWSLIINSILFVITLNIFMKKWKKINREKTYKELTKLSIGEKTTRATERDYLIEKKSLTWHDISTIILNTGNGLRLSDLPLVFVGKQMPSLISLVMISDLKKQIIWNGGLIDALENINIIAIKTYNDEVLKIFIIIVQELIDFLGNKTDYIGTDVLIDTIGKKVSTLRQIMEKEI